MKVFLSLGVNEVLEIDAYTKTSGEEAIVRIVWDHIVVCDVIC